MKEILPALLYNVLLFLYEDISIAKYSKLTVEPTLTKVSLVYT